MTEVAERRVVLATSDGGPPPPLRRAFAKKALEICAHVWAAEAAVQATISHAAHLALLATHLPGGALKATKQITEQAAETAVVLLTPARQERELLAALHAGAVGYLEADLPPTRLANALDGVLRGESAVPRKGTLAVIDEFRARGRRRVALPDGRIVELTDREWEVLELLRNGHTTADIATHLFVAPVTVRSHVSAILRKFDVADREAALRLLEES